MASASAPAPARAKVLTLPRLAAALKRARRSGKRIVFTNGCYDLVHAGHVTLLEKARRLGDILVVGLNSDRSVQSLQKAPGRPVIGERGRAHLLAAFGCVDYVVLFHESTPQRLIETLVPDVLVKGADWGTGEIVGAEAVRRAGGRVVRIPLVAGLSTTRLIERIRLGKSAADA